MSEELCQCPYEETDDAGRGCNNNIDGLCVQRCVNKLRKENGDLKGERAMTEQNFTDWVESSVEREDAKDKALTLCVDTIGEVRGTMIYYLKNNIEREGRLDEMIEKLTEAIKAAGPLIGMDKDKDD